MKTILSLHLILFSSFSFVPPFSDPCASSVSSHLLGLDLLSSIFSFSCFNLCEKKFCIPQVNMA